MHIIKGAYYLRIELTWKSFEELRSWGDINLIFRKLSKFMTRHVRSKGKSNIKDFYINYTNEFLKIINFFTLFDFIVMESQDLLQNLLLIYFTNKGVLILIPENWANELSEFSESELLVVIHREEIQYMRVEITTEHHWIQLCCNIIVVIFRKL